MDKPTIDPDRTRALLDTPYVRVFELAYEDGTRYFDATRHDREHLLALKDDQALRDELPDAVACCLVLAPPEQAPRMVLFREYRYPCAQFLLSIPSGLIDESDRTAKDPLVASMSREIFEECGIVLTESDTIEVVNPFLYNSPGLTDESCALLAVTVRSEAALTHAGAQGTERLADFVLIERDVAWRILRDGRDPWGIRYPFVTWAALMCFVHSTWDPQKTRVRR